MNSQLLSACIIRLRRALRKVSKRVRGLFAAFILRRCTSTLNRVPSALNTTSHDFSDVRAMLDAREKAWLDPRAQCASETQGRRKFEAPDDLRTEYQRDRDRILHTKAFRRLKHKTQVFVSPEQDHYRTRLTHVLEVSQISRTVSRALRLNEDLTEAIGLGHDLGHAPFGHVGEEALNEVYQRFDANGHFRHYEQSLRVVDELENHGGGLNLTFETRDGILYHSKGKSDLLGGASQTLPQTLEGQCVRLCDRVAYVNHDVDDAVRAGLIQPDAIPRDIRDTLGARHAGRITTMVSAIIESSSEVSNGERCCRERLSMRADVREATDALKDWMFEHVYQLSSRERDTVDESTRIRTVISALFERFMTQPELMRAPHLSAPRDLKTLCDRDRARCVCDYVAGMTDRFASQTYVSLFLPASWRGV